MGARLIKQPLEKPNQSCRSLSGPSHAMASQKVDVQRRATGRKVTSGYPDPQRYHDHCHLALVSMTLKVLERWHLIFLLPHASHWPNARPTGFMEPVVLLWSSTAKGEPLFLVGGFFRYAERESGLT